MERLKFSDSKGQRWCHNKSNEDMKSVVLNLVFVVSTTSAYAVGRRGLFQSLGAAASGAAAATLCPRSAQALLSSKYCASGVGEGCTDLADGNDLIRSLQEKSATNRERNEKVRPAMALPCPVESDQPKSHLRALSHETTSYRIETNDNDNNRKRATHFI